MLDAALLTEEEVSGGPQAWAALPDPLPAWDDLEESDDSALQ